MKRTIGRSLVLTLLAGIVIAASPAQTVVVSPTPGNPLRSGITLLRAVRDIASPSASTPWVVKVEPGRYNFGSRTLQMRPFVDIEGSGQGVTVISSRAEYTVFTSNNAELREMTVHNRTTTPQSNNGFDPRWAVIQADPGTNAHLTDLTVVSEGTAHGVRILENASAKLHDVDIEIDTSESGAFAGLSVLGTVEMTGGSVVLNQFGFAVDVGGIAHLKGTTIRAEEFLSNCVRNFAGTVTLVNTTVQAGTAASAIVAAFSAGTVTAHNSILNGALTEVGASNVIAIGASQVINPGVSTTAECVASYAEDFSPVNANCQPIP